MFDIEVHFEEITATLEQAEIHVDGLFINADAGFDSQKLRDKCEAKGIIANLCPNRRNGNNDEDYYFDEKLFNDINIVVKGGNDLEDINNVHLS